MLKSAGEIPKPERYGRSLTYSADLVPAIRAIMQERQLTTKTKRSQTMKELWQDQEYRDLVIFGTTGTPKKRAKPQTFSPEFLAHQGQLKDPEVQKAAKEGQGQFHESPSRNRNSEIPQRKEASNHVLLHAYRRRPASVFGTDQSPRQ